MPINNKPMLNKGEKYNRLTIMGFSHSDKRWRKWYNVFCDCGKQKIIMGSAMVSGNTKSCGCLGKETRRNKRIPNNFSEINSVILGYKRHAEKRGFKWELKRDFVTDIIKKDCFYCGIEPSNIKKLTSSIGNGMKYSGIDRLDSSQNYTENNVVPCCKICNYAKSNLTITEFKEWAIRVGNKAIAEQWGLFLKNTNEKETS